MGWFLENLYYYGLLSKKLSDKVYYKRLHP